MTEKGKVTEELSLAEPVSVEKSDSIADLVRRMLQLIGEDPDRDGLRRTPERFEKALRYLTSGYQQDPEKLLNGAMFSVCYDQMVLVKDIEIYSMCEHHMLPFFGKCHVAYIPDKKVVGLSKIPAAGEYVRAAAADSGAADQPDCHRHSAEDFAAGRGRSGGSAASVHGDARRGEAEFADGYQRDAGLVPR